jgi:2-oxoisovalerate dehydrogenase E1 component
MLRGAIATAKACGRVICFLEPIALYHEKDLYEEGDNAWLFDYPPPPALLLRARSACTERRTPTSCW